MWYSFHLWHWRPWRVQTGWGLERRKKGARVTLPYHTTGHTGRGARPLSAAYEMDQMCLSCVEWTILGYMCEMDHLKIYHIICKAKDWVLPVINLWPARPSYLSETIQTQYKPALSFIISHVLQVAITHIKIQMDRCTSCRLLPQELTNHKAPSTEPRKNWVTI